MAASESGCLDQSGDGVTAWPDPFADERIAAVTTFGREQSQGGRQPTGLPLVSMKEGGLSTGVGGSGVRSSVRVVGGERRSCSAPPRREDQATLKPAPRRRWKGRRRPDESGALGAVVGKEFVVGRHVPDRSVASGDVDLGDLGATLFAQAAACCARLLLHSRSRRRSRSFSRLRPAPGSGPAWSRPRRSRSPDWCARRRGRCRRAASSATEGG